MKKSINFHRPVGVMVLLGSSSMALAGPFSWTVNPGIGYDSNIYRAPGSDYVDYAKTCSPVGGDCQLRDDGVAHPLIKPKVQSGAFLDANLGALYQAPLQVNTVFKASYKLRSRFYLDSAYNNANQYQHKLAIGAQHTLHSSGKLSDKLYLGLKFANKRRLYLDRDSGDEQVFANVDVSGRYTYTMTGAEVLFKHRTGKAKYKLGAEIQKRDYVDEVVISEYDHDYFRVGGEVKYPFSRHTKLSLGYEYARYDYSDRPSRNAQGRLLTSNPKRNYDYNTLSLTLRHRFNHSWLGYVDYQHSQRADGYQAYDDYTKDMIKLRAHYRWNKNKLKMSLAYWERDYPNAFAFDNDAKAIGKQYDGINASLRWIKVYTDQLDFITGLRAIQENSTDLRYDYDRYSVSFAVSWDSQ